MPNSAFDPLRIYYHVVLEDAQPEGMTLFQGFSEGWRQVHWTLLALTTLPGDVLEREAPLSGLISQRMGGARQLSWMPVSISALERADRNDLGLFTVALTGSPDVAARVEAWRHRQPLPVLHASSAPGAAPVDAEGLSTETVYAWCRNLVRDHSDLLDPERLAAAERALDSHEPRDLIHSDAVAHGHLVLQPNQMVLRRAERALETGEPYIGRQPSDYDEKILEGAREILAVREDAGLTDAHRLLLVSPEVFLVEPALFRGAYARARGRRLTDKTAQMALRLIQAQSGFSSDIAATFPEDLRASPVAQALIAARHQELDTFALGVGLRAAQTTSAVIRLSPGVNRVFPALEALGRSIRSEQFEQDIKTQRLFGRIQDQLAAAVGSARMKFLEEEVSGPIKLVTDAPLEWLPVRGLPLMLRHMCSRLNATPGNLLMGQLSHTEVLTVGPEVVRHVLIVTGLKNDDVLAPMMGRAIEALGAQLEGKVRLAIERVHSTADFEAALNDFEGGVLIFHGHGQVADDGVGRILLGDEALDVWSLKGRVRVPPIVILSACDTQMLDSPSHATVANGFLALGAMTVTATLLPIDGRAGAMFIGRLLYRLADFIPAALKRYGRVLNWTEIVQGMQRMTLASEILDKLVGPTANLNEPRGGIQSLANLDINSGNPEWYEELLQRIQDHSGHPMDVVNRRAARALSKSEAIRYVQLGWPENILIDDGSIFEALVPEELRHFAAPPAP